MTKLVVVIMLVATAASFDMKSLKRELMSVLMPGWRRKLVFNNPPQTQAPSPFTSLQASAVSRL